MNLKGMTVLVTGGSAGIGRSLALLFAEEGCRVLVCGRRQEKLETTASLGSGEIQIVVADIATEAGRSMLKSAVSELENPLDILVNNAGVQYSMDLSDANAETELPAKIAEEVNINFLAPVLLSVELLGRLSQPGGTVVNVTSLLALQPKASAPIYCAAKAGLHSFTRSLRYQLAAMGIRVVEAVPPLVSTAMSEGRGSGKITADQAAKEIVEGLKANKTEIRIGKSKIVFLLNRLLPGVVEKMMIKS